MKQGHLDRKAHSALLDPKDLLVRKDQKGIAGKSVRLALPARLGHLVRKDRRAKRAKSDRPGRRDPLVQLLRQAQICALSKLIPKAHRVSPTKCSFLRYAKTAQALLACREVSRDVPARVE